MSSHIARKFTFALTLMLLVAPAGRAFADDCTTDPTIPCVVGGTYPDPQVVSGTTAKPPIVTGAGQPGPQIVMGDLSLINLLQMG